MKRACTRPADAHGSGIAVRMVRALAFVAAAHCVAVLCSCTSVPKVREEVCRACVPDADHIDVHGNVYLDKYPSGLLHRAFANGDTALVTLLGKTHRLTVVSDIREVSPGTAVLHFHGDKPVYDRMAVVNGAFAAIAGIAHPVAAEGAKRPVWKPEEGVEFPVAVAIAKEETASVQPRFRNFAKRSNVRADYPHLTDAEFANFRPIVAPSIASGILYRSSSPIDPSLGRSRYADAALASCGVKTVWNMADTPDEVIRMSPNDSGYAKCRVRAKPLGTDFNSPLFKADILGGLLSLSENEPPFLIHCKEGRDRTGLVAMLLEALGGASRADIEADYVKTFENYARGDFDRSRVAESFAYSLKALGLADAPDTELRARAKDYLRGIGMEEHEIQALMAKLARPVD